MSPRNIKKNQRKNKAPANVNSTIDVLSTDAVNESNNTNEKTHIEPVAETMLKAVYDPEME